MAALTNAQADAVWSTILREQFPGQVISLTKDDLRAAVSTVNSWIDAAASNYGTNLSANAPAFFAATNGQQRALLLYYVLRFKYNLG